MINEMGAVTVASAGVIAVELAKDATGNYRDRRSQERNADCRMVVDTRDDFDTTSEEWDV